MYKRGLIQLPVPHTSIGQTSHRRSAYRMLMRSGISRRNMELCNLFTHLGVRGVSVLFVSGDNGIGKGDCKDSSGNIQFVPDFPASCTCSILSLLESRAQVQDTIRSPGSYSFAYPGLPVSAAQQAKIPRSR